MFTNSQPRGEALVKVRPSTLLSLQALEGRENPASGLGIASNYSAFYFENVNAYWSDIEGRAAIGGNAKFESYSVGTKMPNSNGTRDDLIVGGNLNFSKGQVFYGNTVVGGTASTEMFGSPYGTVKQGQGTPIDFTAAKTELTNLSQSWATLKTNGTISSRYGNIQLTGTNPKQNVFNLRADQLWNAYEIKINAPAGSTVLVNVSGTNARMQFMGMQVNGTSREHVVFNFHQATNLKMQGIGFDGSILAPKANFDFSNGAVRGNVIAKSMHGYGEIELTDPCIHIVVPCCGVTLKGSVYHDANDNGLFETGEKGLKNITVTITGIDDMGNKVNRSVKTDAYGNYKFSGLQSGNYSIKVTTPNGYKAGKSTAGSLGGGTLPNLICPIHITGCGVTTTGYNFGELCS